MAKANGDVATGELSVGVEVISKTTFSAEELSWIRDALDMKAKSLERARTAAKSGSRLQLAIEDDIVAVREIAAKF